MRTQILLIVGLYSMTLLNSVDSDWSDGIDSFVITAAQTAVQLQVKGLY